MPASSINDVVYDRREIGANTTLRLARYFGTSARFWLNAQAAYNLSKAGVEDAGRIAAEVQPPAA